jgi:hypothetical protein
MTEMKIAGNGASICITVIGYERAHADNSSDANWLNCYVDIAVPPFSGGYEASLSTKDFLAFEKDLRSLSERLEGEAVLETDERAISIRISMRSRGLVIITGEATAPTRSSLTFEFDVDQTYLDGYRREVTAILKQYPVRSGDEK